MVTRIGLWMLAVFLGMFLGFLLFSEIMRAVTWIKWGFS